MKPMFLKHKSCIHWATLKSTFKYVFETLVGWDKTLPNHY